MYTLKQLGILYTLDICLYMPNFIGSFWMEFVWYITKKSHLHIDSIGVGYNFSICLVIEFEHNESTDQPTDRPTKQPYNQTIWYQHRYSLTNHTRVYEYN